MIAICQRNLIQNSPSVKKVCSPQEGHCEKDVKSKVADKKWLCHGKILIMTIQVNLVPNPSGEGNTNSPELSLLKFLPLTSHHSHFLAGFHIFFSQ